MKIQWCCLVLLSHFLSLSQNLECNSNTEYPWPRKEPKRCCQKCYSGEYMEERCSENQNTQCKNCGESYYTDGYNSEMSCKLCVRCEKENMVYKKVCTKTSNAACGCKDGYKCSNDNCAHCVKITTTTTTTTTTATTTAATIAKPTAAKPTALAVTHTSKDIVRPTNSQDSVWISLSLCCACVCFLLTCFILISRHTPASGWTMLPSAVCCFWTQKKSSAESSQCSTEEEEEEVPMPVQEVCGGKWQEEV